MWNDVIKNYTDNKIPMDGMWADIDYLDAYKIFTVSPAYPTFKDSIANAKSKGIRFVPIIDPGVAVVMDPETYKPFKTGLE